MMTHVTQNSTKIQDLLLDDFKKLMKDGAPLIGIDYGAVRIGVAISNAEKTIAYPFKIISKLKELDEIFSSKNPCGFVVGLPLQPDATEGFIAGQVRLFTNRLTEKYNLPVFLIDERHTSKRTEEQMKARCIRPKKQIKTLDAQVAALILQNVLNVLNKKI